MQYFILQDADAYINFWHFKAFGYIQIKYSDLQIDLFTKNHGWSAQKILFFPSLAYLDHILCLARLLLHRYLQPTLQPASRWFLLS